MTQDVRSFVSAAHRLVGLGEPTHREPAFPQARNALFARLVESGFRSIALETDRVAALAVNDFVQKGTGTLDAVMDEGFSHGFGAFDANRRLVAWMREHNRGRPAADRLSFHGIDAPLEFTAASPRAHLEYVRDYLGLDLDIAGPAGEDGRWSGMEAVVDPSGSPGDTPEARLLRAIADDMLTALYARAPELIAATSREAWSRAKTHLTSGRGLLRYHAQAAQRVENSVRWSRLGAVRDALMAQNLLDIRDIEARRGPTLVFANNVHLQRHPSRMRMGDMDLVWHGTGAILAPLLGEEYAFIAGTGDRGPAGPGAPSWRLTAADAAEDMSEEDLFPLDRAALDGSDAVLRVTLGAGGTAPEP